MRQTEDVTIPQDIKTRCRFTFWLAADSPPTLAKHLPIAENRKRRDSYLHTREVHAGSAGLDGAHGELQLAGAESASNPLELGTIFSGTADEPSPTRIPLSLCFEHMTMLTFLSKNETLVSSS